MNKTVAIVINTSWNVYNFRLGLLLALQQEGYRIIVIAPIDDYSRKIEDLGIEFHDIKINNKGTNPVEDSKLIYAFYKTFKNISPDILLLYTIKPNIYGSMAAKMLGIPVISNISGLGSAFLNKTFCSKIAQLLYKMALRIPKKVFFQNSYDKQLFIDSDLVSEEQIDILPGSGINTQIFYPNKERASNPTFQFLCVARLVKDKGIVEYEEAARKLKKKYDDVEFAILGAYYPGNPSAITKDEIQQWEKEKIIHYLGTDDDVRSVMLKSDCVVLPSYREGLSRVLLEAASLEKPIVTTNVPGCKDVVDDGKNGFLCDVKDVDSLAEALEKMIDLSEAQRFEMGRYSRVKVINEFDEQIVIRKYSDAIKRIMT